MGERFHRFITGPGVLLLTLALLILGVFYFQYQGRVTVTDGQRAACERGKIDRSAIADALRAQSTYFNGVLAAASVKKDVKDRATVTQVVFNMSATSLESRTGEKLDCDKVFPHPKLLDVG